MLLVHVAQPTLLLRLRLSLPGPIALHQPDYVVGVGHFGHQNVGAFRKVNDRVGPAGVTSEHKRTAQCVEAVGERFVLAVGRRAGLEPVKAPTFPLARPPSCSAWGGAPLVRDDTGAAWKGSPGRISVKNLHHAGGF